MEPVTVVTTIQPLLVLWVVAIAFFVTLAFVAVISRGRSWYELGCIFFLLFLATSAFGLFGTHLVLGVDLIALEVISLK